MFKFALKSLAMLALVLGVCSILSGGKAAADTNGSQCPQPNELYNSSVPSVGNTSLWGYQGGESANNFGGIIVRSHVGNYYDAPSDGPNNIGASIDTSYVLNSYLPAASSGDQYIIPTGDDPNARIFPLSNTGVQNPTSRVPSHTFQTGETLYDNESPANPGGDPFSCTGWSALGPGSPGEAGDNWGMDCGEAQYIGGNPNKRDTNNPTVPTHFWINGLNGNFEGQPGQWEIQVDGATVTTDANGNPMNATTTNKYFTIPNGTSTRVDLIWHPQQPHSNQPLPSAGGACQSLSVTEVAGSTKTRTYVNVSGVTVGRVHYKEGSNEKWWPSQSGPGNLGQSGINTFVGPGSGHDPPDDPNVSGAPAQDGEKNMTVTKDWDYQPNSNSITVTYRTDTLSGSSYVNGTTQYLQRLPNNTFDWTSSPTSVVCFSATCSILDVDGDGPWDGTYNSDGTEHHVVLAGGNMYIRGTFTNTSPGPDYMTMDAGAFLDGPNGTNNLGIAPAYQGYPYPFTITLAAPAAVTSIDPLGFTPQYNASESDMSGCSTPTIWTYQQFTASVSSYSSLSPTSEHPSSASYGATINHQWVNAPTGMAGHGINNPTNVSFYQKLASGGTATPCAPSSYSQTAFNVPSGSVSGDAIWTESCSIPAGSYHAGDEYCSTVSATYSGGWLDPNGNVLNGTGPAAATPDCPRVVNEPYFKVYNGGISAGGEFDQCTTDGGELAGYNDASDPSGADRGSSAELSDLALLKITGVASAQSVQGRNPQNITRPPTDLTFANANPGDIALNNESPSLGGNFSDKVANDGCQTLTNETPPTSAATDTSTNPTIANVAALLPPAGPAGTPNAHVYDNGTGTTKLTINGGTLSGSANPSQNGQNISIFVNGDVTISGNISYGTPANGYPAWADAGAAPSFTLHATGNIYISPNVTSLAGLYIAQKNNGEANSGRIYTCANYPTNPFAPMPSQSLFSCNNQLTVYGSFVADQVNLMRTYGSLRDEEPAPAAAAVGAGPTSSWGVAWTLCAGTVWACSPNTPASGWDTLADLNSRGYNCSQVTEPAAPDSYTWADDYICTPSTSGLNMAWTFDASGPGCNPSPGWSSKACLQGAGYPYCTSFNMGENSWDDNYLCMNQNVNPTFTAAPDGRDCTNVFEGSDPNGQWSTGGYWLCIDAKPGTPGVSAHGPTPKGPPYSGCSNGGIETDANACAGEVFEFSPQLYMANPSNTPPSGGTLQFQSLTGLPPVL